MDVVTGRRRIRETVGPNLSYFTSLPVLYRLILSTLTNSYGCYEDQTHAKLLCKFSIAFKKSTETSSKKKEKKKTTKTEQHSLQAANQR